MAGGGDAIRKFDCQQQKHLHPRGGTVLGDAEFYGNWLLLASKANELLQQAKTDDLEFCKAIDALEMVRCLDFGIMATVFVSQFTDKKFHTFVVNTDSVDLIEFVLMAEMVFFALTGDRYQMTAHQLWTRI